MALALPELHFNRPQSREWTYAFLGSAIVYILWRWSDFLVWDDTSSAGFNAYSNGGHFALSRVTVIVKEAFAYVQSDGYRPISAIIRGIGAAYVLAYGPNPAIFIVANGLMCGLVLVLLLRFAREFLAQTASSYFASFLFLASTPVLTGSLVLFSGIQFLVFVFILATLNVYFAYEKCTDKKWLVVLVPLLIIGPWVREFVGIVAPLILVNELLHRRIMGAVSLIAAAGFLHALFPTFVMSLFVSDLPIAFVFNIGNLRNFIAPEASSENFTGLIARFHWRIVLDLFSILPPSLVLSALLIFTYRLAFDRTISGEHWRKEVFLLVFFAASFLPFLILFNSQVHLAYSLMPLSVLIAAQVEYVLKLQASPKWRAIRAVIFAVITIAVFDHATNIYAVRHVTHDIYNTIISLAHRFQREVPKGTIVISNAHHLEDIRLYANGHIDPWAAVGGIPDRSRWLYGADDYRRFFDPEQGQGVLLLDVRKPQLSGQRGSDRVFRQVQDPIFAIEMVGRIASVSSSYFFFDPLRLLLPTRVTAWTGPPDLEFDFYRGPSLDGALFGKEVAADYYLYLVTGDRIWRWAPHAVLLKESYFSFNIVGFRDRVYAIPQSEGAFDLEKIQKKLYSKTFVANNYDEILRQIDATLE
ncbi:MAG: hypothetical protein GEU77_19285 [Deltaproteobacteria bacterium]|nr:hypothetical protein [Deltaproteobacteria bacterium]